DGEGVPTAPVPARASGTGAVERLVAVGRLGLPVHGRDADRRRARPAVAREASGARRLAPDGEAVWLQAGGADRVSLTVRSKLFLAAFAVGAVSAVTAAVLLNSRLQRLTVERIEQTLAAETR